MLYWLWEIHVDAIQISLGYIARILRTWSSFFFCSNWLIKYIWIHSSHSLHISYIHNLIPTPLTFNKLSKKIRFTWQGWLLISQPPHLKMSLYLHFSSMSPCTMRKKYTSSFFLKKKVTIFLFSIPSLFPLWIIAL